MLAAISGQTGAAFDPDFIQWATATFGRTGDGTDVASTTAVASAVGDDDDDAHSEASNPEYR